jgi:predicted phage terminase large subunit-like protein
LDDRTRRGDILEIIEVLRELLRLWHPDKLLIEKKAAGDNLRVMLQAEMAKGDMPPVQIEVVDPGMQGKEQRLDPCRPALSAGMLHLLDGAGWLEAFVGELAAFPFGQNDDRVDCITQAMNHYAPTADESSGLPEW